MGSKETASDKDAKRQKIVALNDQLRQRGVGGRIVMTAGVKNLGLEMVARIYKAIQEFSDFTPENDPYREHDFGIVAGEGLEKVYWKIDYYDQDIQFGSDDPANPDVTTRVLTIMLPSEY